MNPEKVDVVVAPVALHVDYVLQNINKEIQVCSQNVSQTDFGAFTGEIAAKQLFDFGLRWTLVGHSERRTKFNETDVISAAKTKIALEQGLNVVICIGESLAEREANETMEVVNRQIQAIADVVPEKLWANLVVAYEPVWAIGTGKVATPQQAQEVHQHLRDWVAKNVSEGVANSLRIIYGGSVKGTNCCELMDLPDVDGFLVGGASLKPEFSSIIRCAKL